MRRKMPVEVVSCGSKEEEEEEEQKAGSGLENGESSTATGGVWSRRRLSPPGAAGGGAHAPRTKTNTRATSKLKTNHSKLIFLEEKFRECWCVGGGSRPVTRMGEI